MQLNPRITIRDLPLPSRALKAHIQQKIHKIEQFCDQIMHFDVIVEQQNKQPHKGKRYLVKLAITVPGKELNVNHAANEDVYVATRDAFNAARRRLKSFVQRQKHQVKSHAPVQSGQISQLFEKQGYGFIQSNGHDYYFSETNVTHPTFAQLQVNTPVHFIERMGFEGFQANRVTAKTES